MSAYDHTWTQRIESPDHWMSYHLQISLVSRWLDKGRPVLEIGKGTGLLQDYLVHRGWPVRTVDIDAAKHPDVVADVRGMNAASFEGIHAVLCFETFEHLPFEDFIGIMGEVAIAGVRRVIMSIPFHNPAIAWVCAKLPSARELTFSLRRPRCLRRAVSTHHRWEINLRNLTERKVRAELLRCGWVLAERMVTRPRMHQLFLVLENHRSGA